MNGFVREARIKLDAANEVDNEKVEMKEADFNKLVSNIGKDLCLGKKGCLEYITCSECCKDTLLNYIKIV
ncbi:TPA: hypothetical protein K8N28_001157 [Clostridium perfringens]|uniref:hypothetical protein n=1 Tax=Clostridium perfringens TaxID=1502 RepID=UPI001CABE40E|nr:hypothetical protein [Clostridium perfringens]ELC8346226.1 hypothetical protein [Clostridium perfringens]UBK45261.1 hypothetical protein KLF34_07050 [Clostridium perfringens]HBI6994847.1 hypothetical protein [Clostridium perfringens]HBI7018524.1 hypothetical protein [Clostridium perfringens]HBI7020772.1 hypothetical protein [Clostridium perfringens]